MTTTPRNPQAARRTRGDDGSRRWLALVICCLAAALLGIDNSVLNYAIPSLLKGLHPSATQILWIADTYAFAMGSLLVVAGNLGDRLGRKKLLLTGAGAFGLASVLTAYATSPAMLIAARALLGVAGAMIMPSTLSLVRSTFTDPKERTTAVGISGGIGAAGFALGPVVGGLLLDRFWWGSVFLINVPVMAVVLVGGAVVLRESRNPQPGRLDWVSVPLSVAGLLGVIYAIKTAARDGVHEPAVWISAGAGAVALVLFARRQRRIAHPLLDLGLFRNRAFTGAVGSSVMTLFASTTLALAFSLYFQSVRGWSPLSAGLAMLPAPLAASAAAPLAGALIPRLGRNKVVAAGLALMAVSVAGLGMVTPGCGYWVLLPGLVANGVGLMLVISVTSDTILASAPRERIGAAAAMSETANEIGGALGYAILGSVLTAVYRSGLGLPAGLPAEAAHAARESVAGAVDVAARIPGSAGAALVTAAEDSFTHSMQITTAVAAALLIAAAALALVSLRGVPAEIPDPEQATAQDGTRERPAPLTPAAG